MRQTEIDINRVFYALGDNTRRTIIEKISQGPLSVSQLAKPLAITLAAVVQHLQILEDCGLVRTKKVGRVRTCEIDPAALSALEQWVRERRALWERRFDRLEKLLAETDNN